MAQSVLIIEDDEIIRRAMQMVLEWEGYRVDYATNGQEALDYLRAGGRPSVILLDVMMPVLDGEKFREQQLADPELTAIPVIVVSAARFATSVDGACHVNKPFEVQELLKAIREHAQHPVSPPRS
jgi:CheY-like chemotaxis protein